MGQAQPSTTPAAWADIRPKIAPMVSPGRGRGVHALEAIAAGEVLERCCSVELTSDQCDALEEMQPLGDFYFRHPADPECGLLVLGLASLVNHSDTPNAEVRFEHQEGLGWVASIVARRHIPAGAEILHRYRCPPWFEVA